MKIIKLIWLRKKNHPTLIWSVCGDIFHITLLEMFLNYSLVKKLSVSVHWNDRAIELWNLNRKHWFVFTGQCSNFNKVNGTDWNDASCLSLVFSLTSTLSNNLEGWDLWSVVQPTKKSQSECFCLTFWSSHCMNSMKYSESVLTVSSVLSGPQEKVWMYPGRSSSFTFFLIPDFCHTALSFDSLS